MSQSHTHTNYSVEEVNDLIHIVNMITSLLHNSFRNYEELLSQGSMWEQSGEHSHAIDLYLQLTSQNCSDQTLLTNTWEKVCSQKGPWATDTYNNRST